MVSIEWNAITATHVRQACESIDLVAAVWDLPCILRVRHVGHGRRTRAARSNQANLQPPRKLEGEWKDGPATIYALL